jgi:hypothetical protein
VARAMEIVDHGMARSWHLTPDRAFFTRADVTTVLILGRDSVQTTDR